MQLSIVNAGLTRHVAARNHVYTGLHIRAWHGALRQDTRYKGIP
jgi:hypothetical protein